MCPPLSPPLAVLARVSDHLCPTHPHTLPCPPHSPALHAAPVGLLHLPPLAVLAGVAAANLLLLLSVVSGGEGGHVFWQPWQRALCTSSKQGGGGVEGA